MSIPSWACSKPLLAAGLAAILLTGSHTYGQGLISTLLSKATPADREFTELLNTFYSSLSGGRQARILALSLFLNVSEDSIVLPSRDEETSPRQQSVRRAGEQIQIPEQPMEVIRALIEPSPDRPGAPVTYILNTARSQNGPGGQNVDAPDMVDYVDRDTGAFLVRVDLDSDIPGFLAPQDMALSEDGRTLVVAIRGTDTRFDTSPPTGSHLAVVGIESQQLDRRVFLPARHWPVSVVLSPDGNVAYVYTQQRTEDLNGVLGLNILAIDLASGQELDRTSLPSQDSSPGDLVISPDGGMLWARIPSTIFVIDAATAKIVASIPVAGAATQSGKMVMSPLGHELYLEGREIGRAGVGIRVVDTATATLGAYFEVPGAEGGTRQDIGISSSGRLLLHLDSSSGLFTVIDRLTAQVVDQIETGGPIFQGAIAEGP